MSDSTIIRGVIQDDIPALKGILDRTELFPSELLNGMIGGFLSDNGSNEVWLACVSNGQVQGFCYAAPEELTEGTWNMLALAVSPSMQGRGFAKAVVCQLENELASRGQRILIADTSGTNAFSRTRAFYESAGFTEEARIRDFWGQGDDKVVFWKALN